MVLRTTTNAVLKGYRSNLMKSYSKLNSSMNTVLTHRNFNSYAEDPSAASRAFQLRRAYMRTESQYTSSSAAVGKFESAWDVTEQVILDVNNEKETSNWNKVLRGANDPTGDGRVPLGKSLKESADGLVQLMNTKYGETYIFAGADGLNVPFTWSEDGNLLYRGINVNTSVPEFAETTAGTLEGNTLTLDGDTYTLTGTVQIGGDIYNLGADGDLVNSTNNAQHYIPKDYTINSDGTVIATLDGAELGKIEYTGVTAADGTEYTITDNKFEIGDNKYELDPEDGTVYVIDADTGARANNQAEIDKAKEDLEKLEFLTKEKNFADIGLGMQEDENGKLIESSAYDVAISGLEYFGYGVDADGDPKNIVSIMNRMSELLLGCTENGMWANEADGEEYFRLAGKYSDAASNLQEVHDVLDTQAKFLKSNHQILADSATNINEQFLEIEQCDLADAITAFSWAQYCYNAALKVGNSVLSQSLMDYIG